MCQSPSNPFTPGVDRSRISTTEIGPVRVAALAALGTGKQPSTREFVHTLTTGETLMSTAVEGAQDGTIVLHGSIGPFPYEIEVSVQLDDSGVVTIRLHIRKPVELGPYEWKFNLTGIRRDGNRIIGATGLSPSQGFQAMRLDWWCVLRCGGVAIFGVLLECLPSLAGGPQAFVACVVARLGTSAAQIAECIAHKCT